MNPTERGAAHGGLGRSLRLTMCAACVAIGCDATTNTPIAGTAQTAADPAGRVDKTFDDLKFDLEPGDPFDRSLLTDAIRELDGARLRIRGYILPTAQKRFNKFVLVRDNQECCFGPGAALYDCILVTMTGEERAEFTVRPVAVEGRFEIEEFYGPDGYPLAVFRMDGESVR
ncbi:MAG: DUF3299 domain-containing protein [Planctomycetota bacterium]